MIESLLVKTEIDLINTLKRLWQTDELCMIGKLEKSKSNKEIGFGYISNAYINDRQIFYPKPVVKRSVSIRVPLNDDLVEGDYYKANAKLADLSLREELQNPYLLVLDDQFEISYQPDYLPPNEFIKRWFTLKGESPGDAAKSTKSKSTSMTGYKGIGFKSVFSDSKRVYVNSGSFSFRFDKTADVYKNFRELYKYYYEGKTDKEKRLLEKEFAGKEDEFLNIDNIPWQIKPIWTAKNDYPEEIANSEFVNKSYQVRLALNVGQEIINDTDKDYHKMIVELLDEPRFLLFLRNTSEFRYKRQNDSFGLKISVKRSKHLIEVYKNDEVYSNYIRRDFELSLENEDYEKAGFNFRKTNKDGKTVYVDLEGKTLENIPEKLVNLQHTILSFAAKVENSKIVALNKDSSILFNFLPTSDTRFGFPFLVNADFVSKTDREFIQVENKWNHFLFYHIGLRLIEWLSELVSVVVGDSLYRPYIKTYLELLPNELLDENNSERGGINRAFNNGLKEGLVKYQFIPDSNFSLKRPTELIIDSTNISRILGHKGIVFFKKITNTEKEIPHFLADEKILLKTYLNIEVFKSEELSQLLSDPKNHVALIFALKINNRYLDFIEWLDSFIYKQDLGIDWLFPIPVFKVKSEFYCLKDLFENDNIIIRSEKSLVIEKTLEKLGFSLTEFTINYYPHILSSINQIETYINKDKLLYDKIITKDLSCLIPDEKAVLIGFFDQLAQVGGKSYAEKLPLFKSQKNNIELKSLSALISNDCKVIPSWLMDQVINKEEESILPEKFRRFLIHENDILQRIFTDKDRFIELTHKLASENVTEFYEYVLTLLSKEPDHSRLETAGIPWLYADKTGLFHLPHELYFPDNISKIKDQEQYCQLKSVIEELTDFILPNFSAIPIINILSLGCDKKDVTGNMNKANSFDVISVNHLLDFLKSRQEKIFLKKHIVEKIDKGFLINVSEGKQHFYTPDGEFARFIMKHETSHNLVFFNSELYSVGLDAIGLLENDELIEYLIDNGFAKLELTSFIFKYAKEKIKVKFIEQLPEIKLSTDSNISYDSNSNEHKLIRIIIDVAQENTEYFEKIRNKILINNHPFNSKAVSDDIFFHQFPKINIKLSDVLIKYKNESISQDEIINRFPSISKTELKKVFALKRLKPSEVATELLSLNLDYFDSYKSLILLAYSTQSSINSVFQGKKSFTSLFKNAENDLEYIEQATQFLELCFQFDISLNEKFLIFPDFNPKSTVLDYDFAENDEKLPEWVDNWRNIEMHEEKSNYLIKSGAHSLESAIVNLRKAMDDKNQVLFDQSISECNNNQLIYNSLIWYCNKHSGGDTSLHKSFLKPLFDRAYMCKPGKDKLIIPLVINIKSDFYTLELFASINNYHKYYDRWGEYENAIFNFLKNENDKVIDSLVDYSYFNEIGCIVDEPQKKIDLERLRNSSFPLDAKYYVNWEKKNTYPIMIYPGEALPFKVTYRGKDVLSLQEGECHKDSNDFYVVESKKDDIPFNLYSYLSEEIFKELAELKNKDLTKDDDKPPKPGKKTLIDYLTEEEIRDLETLLKRPLSANEMANIFIAALFRAITYYENQHYDLSKVKEHIEDAIRTRKLENVFHNHSEERKTIYVRSAKGGLLYMKFAIWHNLKETENELFVVTGNYPGEHIVFENQEQLCEHSNDSWVFRLNGPNKLQEITELLNGEYERNEEKQWADFEFYIRIGSANYSSIFEQIYKNQNNSDFNDLD